MVITVLETTAIMYKWSIKGNLYAYSTNWKFVIVIAPEVYSVYCVSVYVSYV